MSRRKKENSAAGFIDKCMGQTMPGILQLIDFAATDQPESAPMLFIGTHLAKPSSRYAK